jgi:hypothetical protein
MAVGWCCCPQHLLLVIKSPFPCCHVSCCCLPSEFVQLVSTQANEASAKDGKATITPEHVLSALDKAGFGDLVPEVRLAWEAFKDDAKQGGWRGGGGAGGWGVTAYQPQHDWRTRSAIQTVCASACNVFVSGVVTGAVCVEGSASCY